MKTPSIPVLSAALLPMMLVSCIEPVPPPPPGYSPSGAYPGNRPNPYGNPAPGGQDEYDGYGGPPSGNYGQQSSGNPDGPAPIPAPTPSPRPGEYPVAKPTAKADEVVSPYEPYNIINVEGYRSGELVRDPHNKKIFRVP